MTLIGPFRPSDVLVCFLAIINMFYNAGLLSGSGTSIFAFASQYHSFFKQHANNTKNLLR